jgi:hypothetical protein
MSAAALLARRLLAGIAALASGVAFAAAVNDNRELTLIPIAALLVAAVAVHSSRLGPQLVARAAWWSSFALGVVLCLLGGRGERHAGIGLTLACGGALLLVGHRELGAAGERGGYVPAAFRSSLLLLMVLALADAQTFLLLGGLTMNKSGMDDAPGGLLLVAASALYLAGFVGLYRLALWGAIVNVVTSGAALLAFGPLEVSVTSDVRPVILTLAAVHVLAASPMLVSALLKRPLPQASPRVRALGASAVVAVVGLSSVLFALNR